MDQISAAVDSARFDSLAHWLTGAQHKASYFKWHNTMTIGIQVKQDFKRLCHYKFEKNIYVETISMFPV